MTQFDLFSEQSAKEHGIARAAESHESEIAAARDMAIKIAAQKGSVTIDDLRDAMPRMAWGPWSGSIFKDRRFVPVGFTPATHEGSHARIIRKWSVR